MSHPLLESLKQNHNDIDKITKENGLHYKKYGTVAIFKYDKTVKYGTELQRQSRGAIIDLSTNKVVCTSFNGCLSLEQFKTNVIVDNCIVEENIEGTLINLYFYNNIWKISTKFSLNADETKFRSNKTFRQLFDELFSIDTSILDNKFTYSFIIVHKELRLVTPVTENKIYHIETTNNTTGEKIYCDIGIKHPKILFSGNKYAAQNANIDTFDTFDTITDKLNEQEWLTRGYMLYSIDRKNHCSLINPNYDKVRQLVSNQNDIRYISLESLFYKHNNNEILRYFPEYNELFVKTVIDYNMFKKQLYKFYLDKMCFKKTNIDIPRKYNKAIFDIHGYYLKEKNMNHNFKISRDDVDKVLKNYDCPYLFTLLFK